MEPINIIALAESNWDGAWMNRQQLLSRLGKNCNILYSNGVMSTWEIGTKRWKASPLFSQYERKSSVTLHRPGKIILRNERFTRYENIVLKAEINKWKKIVDVGCSSGITYVFGPNFKKYVELIEAKFLVYHVYDLFEKYTGWNDEKDIEHNWMLENSDLVIASSEIIAEHLESISGRCIKILENGVDYQTFSSRETRVPDDLKNIPNPRLMYVGNINRKVDLALVNKICQRNCEWQWVFVGRIGNLDEKDKVILQKLKNRDNVHFLGAKPHGELAAYENHSDINMMIYKEDKNLWVNATYPLKLNEYLATGKPVVSIGLEAVKKYANIIEIASGVEQWIDSIQKLLDSSSETLVPLRREEAKNNDWNNKTLQLEKWLTDLF